MNKKYTVERVLFYHLDIDIFDNEEDYSLLRAVMYKDKADYEGE